MITGVGSDSDRQSLGTMIAFALKRADPTNHITGIYLDDPCDFCDKNIYMDLSCKVEHVDYGADSLDCLINAAGTNKMNWFEDMTYDDFQHVMKVNLEAPIFLIQNLLPELIKAKGTVLNIISMGAHKPFRTSLPYNVSKAALKMATHQLARELSDVTVFGISPNELEGTGMTLDNAKEIQRIRGWSEEQAEKYRLASGAGERADPMVLAEFIAYLLIKKERHINLNGVDLYYGD